MTDAQTSGVTWPVPAREAEAETQVRKSRFIARAAPAASREEALALVERARLDHPEARHHCWAYVIGAPGRATSAAMNDDGEPSGTAGRPILNVIEHKGIGDVAVVVIRYFGGVKLGAGGLVRAYAGAAEAVLSSLELEHREPRVSLQLEIGFADEQPLRLELERLGGELAAIEYGQGVSVQVSVPATAREAIDSWAAGRGLGVTEL
ncbi:YigZ family protein [Halovibrio salipaludis]|uniref:YigZ family protein n=1 Tax=Halovibrio salipaludis TaxID=2032626 RepID=A0A2A2EZL6_9GAMM|nr:YigZ family protein [Halovibrio salipaludis]PAU77835.1 YigZ family protein [Halovibrio salipaludis]